MAFGVTLKYRMLILNVGIGAVLQKISTDEILIK
jgi:hypothetical protein